MDLFYFSPLFPVSDLWQDRPPLPVKAPYQIPLSLPFLHLGQAKQRVKENWFTSRKRSGQLPHAVFLPAKQPMRSLEAGSDHRIGAKILRSGLMMPCFFWHILTCKGIYHNSLSAGQRPGSRGLKGPLSHSPFQPQATSLWNQRPQQKFTRFSGTPYLIKPSPVVGAYCLQVYPGPLLPRL